MCVYRKKHEELALLLSRLTVSICYSYASKLAAMLIYAIAQLVIKSTGTANEART